MPSTCALILAAGYSRRFGADKRQQRLADGRTLLQASLALPCARFDEVWLALREDDALPDGLPPQVRVLRSADSRLGLGHSIAASIARIAQTSNAEAVALFLADMPFIQASTVDALLAQAQAQRICRPMTQGQAGHPVVFGRRFWPELAELRGDDGARAVLTAHPEAVTRVEVEDPGVLQDIDRPGDLPVL